MKRIYILCEGPTEETFVKQILVPAFSYINMYLIPIMLGGVSKYSIIRNKLQDLCRHDKRAYVTMLLDYYGMPSETPGIKDTITGDIYQHISYIEQCIGEDVGEDNLIPNLLLHEFEALLFSKPECFVYCGMKQKEIDELCKIRFSAETPEHINNDPMTAPSKRILKLYPKYQKPLHGYSIASDIGLDTIRKECHHFDDWLNKLENLPDIVGR